MNNNMKTDKLILDACCGGRMFYFDKNDDRVLFQDIRSFETTLCDGRKFEIKPDIHKGTRDRCRLRPVLHKHGSELGNTAINLPYRIGI